MKTKMILIILVLVILLVACSDNTEEYTESLSVSIEWIDLIPDSNQRFYRIHDDELNVTCWRAGNDSIFCIPDWQLTTP